MCFGGVINLKGLMFTLKHSIIYQLHEMGIKGDERMSEFEGSHYVNLTLGSCFNSFILSFPLFLDRSPHTPVSLLPLRVHLECLWVGPL